MITLVNGILETVQKLRLALYIVPAVVFSPLSPYPFLHEDEGRYSPRNVVDF
jgi:hypothetical protein